jgi:hypothetical protein
MARVSGSETAKATGMAAAIKSRAEFKGGSIIEDDWLLDQFAAGEKPAATRPYFEVKAWMNWVEACMESFKSTLKHQGRAVQRCDDGYLLLEEDAAVERAERIAATMKQNADKFFEEVKFYAENPVEE